MTEINSEQMEPQIIKTQDENGEIHNFELIDIINVDNMDYGLLIHLDENENHNAEGEEEEEEVVIMRLCKEDDAYTFETIEDQDEFDKVVAALEETGDLDFTEEE